MVGIQLLPLNKETDAQWYPTRPLSIKPNHPTGSEAHVIQPIDWLPRKHVRGKQRVCEIPAVRPETAQLTGDPPVDRPFVAAPGQSVGRFVSCAELTRTTSRWDVSWPLKQGPMPNRWADPLAPSNPLQEELSFLSPIAKSRPEMRVRCGTTWQKNSCLQSPRTW